MATNKSKTASDLGWGWTGEGWNYSKPSASKKPETAADQGWGWTGDRWNYDGSARPSLPSFPSTGSAPRDPANWIGGPVNMPSSFTTSEQVIDRGRVGEMWKRLLANQAANLDADARATRAAAAAQDASILREGFNRIRALREQLSAAGAGYSPRFAGRGFRDIAAETTAERMASRARARGSLVDALRNLANYRAQASQELSDAELEAYKRDLGSLG